MTGALHPVWPCWNHVQSSSCPWLREEVEPMTELHGRLIGFLDVISLEAFASDPARGAAGRPPRIDAAWRVPLDLPCESGRVIPYCGLGR